MPPQLLALLRIALHPFADAVHRHLVLRDDVALDQEAADRDIGMAVGGLHSSAAAACRRRAARAPSPGYGRRRRRSDPSASRSPDRGRPARRRRWRRDRSRTRTCASRCASSSCHRWQRSARHRHAAARQQVRRLAIERIVEAVGLLAHAIDDRLVIAGEKPSGLPSGEMRTGRKFCSKKARASPGFCGLSLHRLAADLVQRAVHRPAGPRRPAPAGSPCSC